MLSQLLQVVRIGVLLSEGGSSRKQTRGFVCREFGEDCS